MAAYAVVDYVVHGTPESIAAAFETKLETLDSTTNPVRLITIQPNPRGGANDFVGILVYDGS